MHDLLEWVCLTDIALLHQYIKIDKKFTLAQPNPSINGFSYDKNERNKPTKITENYLKQINITMSAAEMLCFVNNLNFLIGHLIEEHNIHWSVFLILKQIIVIVISRKIHVSVHYLL